MGSTAVVIVKNNSGFCERPARKILIIIIEMGNCCDNKAKVPSPYQFLFNSRDKLAENEQHFEQNSIKTSKYNIASFVPRIFWILSVSGPGPAVQKTGEHILPDHRHPADDSDRESAVADHGLGAPDRGDSDLHGQRRFDFGYSGYEDYQRYKSDKQLNFESSTKVRRDNKFQTVPWSEVVVGDIVMVEEGEMFPADLILLASSIEGGNAYIETASLDGNLFP